MKLLLTIGILTLALSGLALCNFVYPPPTKDTKWLTGKDKEKEEIDVSDLGGN